VDPQALGRVSPSVDPPAAPLEHLLHVATEKDVEIGCGVALPLNPGVGRQRRIEVQGVTSGGDHRPLDDVFQFSDVARPVVLLQLIDESLRHFGNLPVEIALVAVDEEPDELRDVIQPSPSAGSSTRPTRWVISRGRSGPIRHSP